VNLSAVPAGVWGVLGTLLGAYAVYLTQRRLKVMDEPQSKSRDYRAEIDELVERLDRLENEVTFWRSRFYTEQEANARLRILLIQNNIVPPEGGTMVPTTPHD
jgi:hypothetical protein